MSEVEFVHRTRCELSMSCRFVVHKLLIGDLVARPKEIAPIEKRGDHNGLEATGPLAGMLWGPARSARSRVRA